MRQSIQNGVVHRVPSDVREILLGSKAALLTWQDITPLARNEYLCWIMSAKKPETRVKRITRARDDLINNKRRPCCFAGCTHRN